MNNEKENAVLKVLGEPVFVEFSDNLLKIRRNLLILSATSVLLVMGEVKVSNNFSLFGLDLEGLKIQLILRVFF